MPCWTVNEARVNIGAANLDLLEQALKTMGHRVTRQGETLYFGDGYSYTRSTQELRIPRAEMANEIKRAYSAEIVLSQAKRFNWTVKKTGPYQYEILKR
jgi:hypothetical protein